MAHKLHTYRTSLGFFELAVAAPSMKAALEAWGSKANLFHQGFAQETDDPAITASAMAQPGVVLKRAVGSKAAFSEDAALPTSLPAGKRPPKIAKVAKKPKAKKKAPAVVVNLAEEREARRAALAYDKEKARQEAERRRHDAKREEERQLREKAVAKARAAFSDAEQKHEAAMQAIENERAKLDDKAHDEDARWKKQKEKLEADLQRARE